MTTQRDPRPTSSPASGPIADSKSSPPASVGPQRLSKARPESTVTLMVQSGQAPGAVSPQRATPQVPAAKPGVLTRAWLAVKAWF